MSTRVPETATTVTTGPIEGSTKHYLDVGGGLGGDYDGSQTKFPPSLDYTVQE